MPAIMDNDQPCTAICNTQTLGEGNMAKSGPTKSIAKGAAASTLMVRLDRESKSYLQQAAKLRRLTVSDYVRVVTVAQASREVQGAHSQTIVLTPSEQLSFWKALNAPVRLSAAQKRLGSIMRGET